MTSEFMNLTTTNGTINNLPKTWRHFGNDAIHRLSLNTVGKLKLANKVEITEW